MSELKLNVKLWSNIQELKHWLWSTIMQSERIRECEKIILKHMRSANPYSLEGQLAFSQDWANVHFFFISAANLCKCFNKKLPKDLKNMKLSESVRTKIVYLRNITEHWEENKKAFENIEINKNDSPSVKWFKLNYPKSVPFKTSNDAKGFLLCDIFNLDEFDNWTLSINELIKLKYIKR